MNVSNDMNQEKGYTVLNAPFPITSLYWKVDNNIKDTLPHTMTQIKHLKKQNKPKRRWILIPLYAPFESLKNSILGMFLIPVYIDLLDQLRAPPGQEALEEPHHPLNHPYFPKPYKSFHLQGSQQKQSQNTHRIFKRSLDSFQVQHFSMKEYSKTTR